MFIAERIAQARISNDPAELAEQQARSRAERSEISLSNSMTGPPSRASGLPLHFQ
jgi:hypothetical protein